MILALVNRKNKNLTRFSVANSILSLTHHISWLVTVTRNG